MGTVQVKQVDRIKATFWEKSYIPEFVRGLAITSKHFFSNLLSPAKAPLNYAQEGAPAGRQRDQDFHPGVP